MKKIIYSVFIILLLIIWTDAVSSAQSSQKESLIEDDSAINHTKRESAGEDTELNKEYFMGYVLDTRNILTSPLQWEKSDWIKASVIVGITAGLYAFDQEIQDWVEKNRSNTSDDIAKFAKVFGDGKYVLPPLGILYLYGYSYGDKKAKRTALLSLESFVVSGIFTQAVKFSGHRHRPRSEDSYDTWDGPGFSSANLSFPSGHTQTAFSIATVIAHEYDDIVVVPPLAYGIATLTALSRVNDDAHWASDVFFGAAIGYFTGRAIVHLHSKKDNKLTIAPVIDNDKVGLLMSYAF